MTGLLKSKTNALPETAKGVLLALVSTALFVTVGVLVRILSERIDVFQILFFRQLVFITVLLPAIFKNSTLLMKPRLVKLHLLRVTGAFCALSLGFITVSNMPLAEATALGFTKVLFVALISSAFLSETIGSSRKFTLLVGFLGVMLVVQPSFDNMALTYSLSGLGAALGAAVAVICVRKITQTEPTITLLAYQAIFVGALALIPAMFHWQWPTVYELTLLVSVGGISSLAQWIGVTAYKYGEANVVANVEYAKMIYSLILGYCIFSEVPDVLSLAGASLIFASVFLPHLISRLAKRIRKSFLSEST